MKNEMKITDMPEFKGWLKTNRRDIKFQETSFNKYKKIEKTRDVFMVATFLSLITLIVVITLSILPLSYIQ